MDKNEINDKTAARPYDIGWLASCAVVTAIATFLRFYWLGLKPFHHDEGVNGFFLKTLFDKGTYAYDPANYHGPTLYYISLAFAKVFGLETVPVRSSVTDIMSALAFRKKSRFPSRAKRGTNPPSNDTCTFGPLAPSGPR